MRTLPSCGISRTFSTAHRESLVGQMPYRDVPSRPCASHLPHTGRHPSHHRPRVLSSDSRRCHRGRLFHLARLANSFALVAAAHFGTRGQSSLLLAAPLAVLRIYCTFLRFLPTIKISSLFHPRSHFTFFNVLSPVLPAYWQAAATGAAHILRHAFQAEHRRLLILSRLRRIHRSRHRPRPFPPPTISASLNP